MEFEVCISSFLQFIIFSVYLSIAWLLNLMLWGNKVNTAEILLWCSIVYISKVLLLLLALISYVTIGENEFTLRDLTDTFYLHFLGVFGKYGELKVFPARRLGSPLLIYPGSATQVNPNENLTLCSLKFALCALIVWFDWGSICRLAIFQITSWL